MSKQTRGHSFFRIHLDNGSGSPFGTRWLYINVWRWQIRIFAGSRYGPQTERLALRSTLFYWKHYRSQACDTTSWVYAPVSFKRLYGPIRFRVRVSGFTNPTTW